MAITEKEKQSSTGRKDEATVREEAENFKKGKGGR